MKKITQVVSSLVAFTLLAFAASNASAQVYLEPGDLVTSINGRQIYNVGDFVQSVNMSGPVMYFTIVDRRSNTNMNLATNLHPGGFRFGVYVADNGGYGVRITGLMQNSAAFRCWQTGGNWGGNWGGGGAAAAAAMPVAAAAAGAPAAGMVPAGVPAGTVVGRPTVTVQPQRVYYTQQPQKQRVIYYNQPRRTR